MASARQTASSSNLLRIDAIKVAKVEDVFYRTVELNARGTIHLTAHHLIFKYSSEENQPSNEIWVPYPLISLVTRLPQTLQGQSPLSLQCRTFRMFSLVFENDSDALDVFDTVRELTVASSVFQLYAFFYVPNPSLPVSDGWTLYSPREEFARMGVGSRSKAWRFTDINKDYSFSPTYPARLVVPTRISDVTLQYAAKHRSKSRIPALVYLHWANFGSITRGSQPLVGLTNTRSVQDEKLVEAIFQSHNSPETRVSSGPIYGATTTNLIIDARGATAAVANHAKGGGSENMDNYKDCKKLYLGIENIHTMRESLNRVIEALREADALAASVSADSMNYVSDVAFLDRHALRRSGWLRHISTLLEGTLIMVRNIHVNSSHVFVHCSDGWDRTAQLSSLAQICLDPFYRTVRGFQILVEKDWISFGFRFLDRCGHLSSEKFFVSPVDSSAGGAEAAQAFLASVQNRFSGQNHLKETSPVFHQFLESLRQLQRQFPERFEYSARFLEQLHYHLYSCQFGSFLFNCERELKVGQNGPAPWERTVSVWDFLNSPPEAELNLNPLYDPSLDNPSRRDGKADMGVLYPNPKDIRFWHELYGRSDEDMNGPPSVLAQDANIIGIVDVDTDEAEIIPVDSSSTPQTSTSQTLSSTSAVKSLSISRSKTPEDQFIPGPSLPTVNMVEPITPTKHGLSQTSTPRSKNREQSSTSRGRNRPAEIFSSTNMRSVWGKLSSNASAALTAVQGAYDGVAQEIKDLSVSFAVDQESSRNRELEDKDISTTGNNDRTLEQEFGHIGQSSSSPWSSNNTLSRNPSFQSGVPSRLIDNPWKTTRDISSAKQESRQRIDDIFGSTVWNDSSTLANSNSVHNISHGIPKPTSLSSPSHRSLSNSTLSKEEAGPLPNAEKSVENPAPADRFKPNSLADKSTTSQSVDPLGVGLVK